MYKILIRIIKKCVNSEMQEYVDTKIEKCPVFSDGQLFETEYEKPQGFCDWAWNDLHPYIAVLLSNGNFSEGLYQDWMKDKDTMIACCTDGIRPVVFEITRIKK